MMTGLFARLGQYAILPLRLVMGIVFMAHGSQKLFGWFGGPGFAGTAEMFGHLGLPGPGWLHAAMGGGGEFFGGLLIFLGLATRLGAFLTACTMLVAITVVHWSGGLFAANNGFEYPLTLLAVSVSLMLSGGGKWALENLMPCCKHSGQQSEEKTPVNV